MFFFAGSFNSDSPAVVVHEQSVYTVEPGKIQVRTFQVFFHVMCYNIIETSGVSRGICKFFSPEL